MRSPLLIAILNPLNIAMLVISALAGLLAAWWLFPVGILVWLVMVMLVAFNPSLRMYKQMEKRAPLTQRFQPYYNRLENSQVRIYRVITGVKPKVRQKLNPLWHSLDELVDQAYFFCEQLTVLENHRLVSQRGVNINDNIADLDYRIEHEEDENVRKEFEDSRAALQNRYANMLALGKQLDRAEAHLTTLTSELAQTLTETIRIQSLPPDQLQAEVERLRQNLETEKQRLQDFEMSVPESS